jgi:adenine-specific DNA-methyltransferase
MSSVVFCLHKYFTTRTSLFPYLSPKSQTQVEERLRHLLAYNEEAHRFNRAETEALITAINRLKILDPACGSGAYPMGILHKLVFILGKLDPDNARWKKEQIEQQIRPVQADIQIAERISDEEARAAAIDQLQERLAEIREKFERNEQDYPRKLFLIENCIYGVDIQPVAVQIAKLRFFISLVVDQRIDDEAPNRGILPLPNLETKFVAANTLLGIEKPAQMGLRNPAIAEKEQELAEVRSKHFRARTPTTKEKYRLEDKRLRAEIGRLLQKDGFPNETTALLANWDPYDQNARADFFDREWMFGLERGFDIVIGNPPYVRQEKIRPLKPALKEQYKCYTGIADLYVYFFENGVNLLREGGVLCYICSNKYFRAGYGKKLRHFLSRKTTIRQLIDFGDAPVFRAIAYPSIICLQKTSPNGSRLHAFNWEPGPAIAEFEAAFEANRFTMPQAALTADGWRLESPEVLALLAKLQQMGKPLGEYVNGRFYYGIKTGLNEAFVIDQATRDRLVAEHPSSAEIIKPFLRGRDVKRWQVTFDDQYLIKIESSANKRHPWTGKPDKEAEKIFAKTYPAIYAHFEPYRKRLIKRYDQGKYYWELRACAYWEEFSQPKIIIPAIAQSVEYAPDTQGFYSNDKSAICVTDLSSYLSGLLNSQLHWWYIQQVAASRQGGFYEFKPMYVSEIPIVDTDDKQPIETRVEQILVAKEDNPSADVSALEQEIDQLVYELYRLTPAEIALIEGREMSEEEQLQSPLPTTEAVGSNRFSGSGSAPPLLFTGRPPQGSFSEKMKRIETLTKQAGPAAIQELVAALSDDSDTIRWQAGAALRTIGGPQVVGVLQAFIAHSDDPTAQQAARDVLEKLAI